VEPGLKRARPKNWLDGLLLRFGSSMLAITLRRPPQRTHCSISIPNTRFRRRAQFMRTCLGCPRSGGVARLCAPGPLPAGGIAARSAACETKPP